MKAIHAQSEQLITRSAVQQEALNGFFGTNARAAAVIKAHFPDNHCSMAQVVALFESIRKPPGETAKSPDSIFQRYDRPALGHFYGLAAVPKGNYGYIERYRLPAIGECVCVACNALGPGRVVAYYVEGICLGVEVRLDHPPAWFEDTHGDKRNNSLATLMDIQPT